MPQWLQRDLRHLFCTGVVWVCYKLSGPVRDFLYIFFPKYLGIQIADTEFVQTLTFFCLVYLAMFLIEYILTKP